MRPSQRQPDELRPFSFVRHFTEYAEGSVLTTFGNTKVLCTASVTEGVPRFLRDADQGWITAEYGMLPRSTQDRMDREAARGKQCGRTVEIQRLIGRALRAAVNLKTLKQHTITIDCDVIQADGGTRTAAISGAFIALVDALTFLQQKGRITVNPLRSFIAAVSVGIYQGVPVLDLDYAEDSKAQTDMNIIMTDQNTFVEIQGTAEDKTFHEQELAALINLAKKGIEKIIQQQKYVLDYIKS